MSKKAKDEARTSAKPASEGGAVAPAGQTEAKEKKQKKPTASSKKLHVEIARGNWKRLEKFIDDYNKDPERMTPKLKQADVINEALALYLQGDGKPAARR